MDSTLYPGFKCLARIRSYVIGPKHTATQYKSHRHKELLPNMPTNQSHKSDQYKNPIPQSKFLLAHN